MPAQAPAAPAKPVSHVKTIADQQREAMQRELENLKQTRGWYIYAPAYPFVGNKVDYIHIHPHTVTEGKRVRQVKGATIELIGGKGYTDNEDYANFIRDYWIERDDNGEAMKIYDKFGQEVIDEATGKPRVKAYRVEQINVDPATQALVQRNEELLGIIADFEAKKG